MVSIMPKNQTEDKIKRTWKTKSIAELAGRVNNRAFRRYGFAKSDIHLHWNDIVGPVLARSSLPERLVTPKQHENTDNKAGTLHVRVDGSYAPEMQHLEPLVIDRINSYYGFKAVEKLIFRHGLIEENIEEIKYQPPILSDSQKNDLETLLQDIKDDKLRKSLFDVGAEILARAKPEKPKQNKRFTRRGKGSVN